MYFDKKLMPIGYAAHLRDVVKKLPHVRKDELFEDDNWWRVRWFEEIKGKNGKPRRVWRSAVVGPCKGPKRMTRNEATLKAWEHFLCDAYARRPVSAE